MHVFPQFLVDVHRLLIGALLAITNFANSNKLNFHRPKALCLELSDLCEQSVGGTTGAIYALFFSAAAISFTDRFDEKQLHSAICKGLWSIEYFGRARKGNRTMVDALCAAAEANPNEKWSEITKVQNCLIANNNRNL
jgi:hypothetical protein